MFGVAVATTGLATFALVLALLQQVVLEVIDENVKQGRRVYEEKHVRAKPAHVRADPRSLWHIVQHGPVAARCHVRAVQLGPSVLVVHIMATPSQWDGCTSAAGHSTALN